MRHSVISTLVFSIIIFSVHSVNAQSEVGPNDSIITPEVIQLSGVLVTGDSLMPVPYSNIFRTRDNTGVISNALGFFTLPAFKGDTIMFSNIGYRNVTYTIPLDAEGDLMNIVQLIAPDTVQLEVTQVYPWPSKASFAREFLALELPDDNLARQQRNLDPVEMQKRMEFLGPESAASAKYAMNAEALRLQSMGTAQNLSLLNPFAWAQFLSALRNGDFRRQ
ncbi:MAG: hypothetical protein AB8B53_06335 [Flavobacteriales bacterium]